MIMGGSSNILHFGGPCLGFAKLRKPHHHFIFRSTRRFTIGNALQAGQQSLLIVGGGAAGIYAAIRARTLAPFLEVLVIEKGKPLSKVKISGGGRCNVTNGHCIDKMALAANYPRGNTELKGSYFSLHGPTDTMSWFTEHGVNLKTEEDGRVFPVSDNSSSIVDCLLHEANRNEVRLQIGRTVTNVSITDDGKFLVKIEKRTINLVEHFIADYLLLATGSIRQGYDFARQLGHSIVDPVPSLFTFKIADAGLSELCGVTFPKVKAHLKLQNVHRNLPQHTQIGPMLVTHWGLSGPVVLRLSAWAARELFETNYSGTLLVDFVPDLRLDDVKCLLHQHKDQFGKQKMVNSFPPEFFLVKRLWKYFLDKEGLDGDIRWAYVRNACLNSIALLLKQCSFEVNGKGQFKDEFVTAGGVPLTEISMTSMESNLRPHLFFAGEILNIDGVTGGFNFQNAWTSGYIAGTSIAKLSSSRFGEVLTQDIGL